MGTKVIEIEGISKRYTLGTFGRSTFREDLANLFGQKKDKNLIQDTEKEYWALKDINFSVNQGEALAIIGKNGAGKSTLLKILSRITAPTGGTFKVKGRMASLLEVGTGFHPELSGRDNIFLNGAILGMKKAEIKSKLDEIVDFSGIEKFIDTPVKRYSSGMYVRLAFAVAAHLEPEILIIDEVLAVGDAEFQKKCLGKMKDVSGEGRTVLFVSHNMTAVNSLCSRAVYLKSGKVIEEGPTEMVVNKYLSTENVASTEVVFSKDKRPGDEVAKLLEARLVDENLQKIDFAYRDQKIGIQFTYEVLQAGHAPIPNIHVYTSKAEFAFVGHEKENADLYIPGIHKTVMWIPGNFLNEGTYLAGIALSTMLPEKIHFYAPELIVFDIIEDINKRTVGYRNSIPGVVRPNFEWTAMRLR